MWGPQGEFPAWSALLPAPAGWSPPAAHSEAGLSSRHGIGQQYTAGVGGGASRQQEGRPLQGVICFLCHRDRQGLGGEAPQAGTTRGVKHTSEVKPLTGGAG